MSSFSYSAVIPNYNDGDEIKHSLECLSNQTRPFDEILIIDDGSTDNSVSIIESIIKDIPYARLIRNETNLGIVNTVNRGMKEAKGDFVFAASANDSFDTRILEWAEEVLDQHPNVGMVCGNTLIVYDQTGERRKVCFPIEQKTSAFYSDELRKIASKRFISLFGGATILRRKEALELGGFLKELEWNSDWHLFLMMADKYGVGYVPEVFCNVHVTPGQYSSAAADWSKQSQIIRNIIRITKDRYPDQISLFRDCALLPTYDIQAIWLIISNKDLRYYLSWLLLYRLVFFKVARVVASVIPRNIRGKIRPLFRL